MEKRVDSVLFITHHYPPEIGGIQTRIENYTKTLRAMNVRVSVAFFTRTKTRSNYTDSYGRHVMVSSGRIANLPRNVLMIFLEALRGRAEVIHVFSGASTFVGIASLSIGRLLGIPRIISVWGREELDLVHMTQRVGFPVALALSTGVVVNTRFTAGLLPLNARRKVSVILGGAGSSPQIGETKDRKTILFVGRLVKSKGVDDLIRAFGIVEKVVPNVNLNIVGDGPEMGVLIELAKELGVSNSTNFLGFLRGDALAHQYDSSSTVVLPSKGVPGEKVTETFGFSLVEGAMHGRPLIGTSNGGIPEIIADGTNGILVPENNPKMLALALQRVLADEELSSAFGRNALLMARERFTWEKATIRLLKAYVSEPNGPNDSPGGEVF